MTTNEPGPRRCPFCVRLHAAQAQGVPLRAVVPVWTCLVCKTPWTHDVAEAIRAIALADALDGRPWPTEGGL